MRPITVSELCVGLNPIQRNSKEILLYAVDVCRIRLIDCHLPRRDFYMDNTAISFKDVYDSNNLLHSFYKWSKTSRWKYKTQQYEANLLVENNKLKSELQEGYFELTKDVKPFVLKERDKIRYVVPHTVRDSVALTSFCENVSHKVVYPKLIYNNGSSIKGKGVSEFRKQFERDLHRFWINNGNNGYILLIDFSKYYDNIRHSDVKEMFGSILPDDGCKNFFNKVVDNSAVDASKMSDEEYKNALHGVFNSLDFYKQYGILNEGFRILPKSTGIGNPNSCDIALYYAHEVDDYIKIVKGIKGYGRFTDDSYIIHSSKTYLEDLLREIAEITEKRGIHINKNKTKIISLKDKFELLHTEYKLLENGRLIKEIASSTIKREKRKLKKFREKLNENRKPIEEIYHEYQSWRGSLKYYDSTKQIMKMDRYFDSLFHNEVEEMKLKNRILKKSSKKIRSRILHATTPDEINLNKIFGGYYGKQKTGN